MVDVASITSMQHNSKRTVEQESGNKGRMKRGRKTPKEDHAASAGSSQVESESEMGKREKYTFFYTTSSPFSQFHPAKFTVDGITYNCAEQYMMHQKAVTFDDPEMAENIMKSSDPKKMKGFGRKVRNFDDGEWKAKCQQVVKKGNQAKFGQNKDLKRQLLATVGSILVEASPRDRLWGIGLGAQNPKAQTKRTWRGRNWLGYILTEVRDELIASETKQEKSDQ